MTVESRSVPKQLTVYILSLSARLDGELLENKLFIVLASALLAEIMHWEKMITFSVFLGKFHHAFGWNL
jgi:hypothetical protein